MQSLAVTNSSWSLDWNGYPDGNYLSTSAIADFGNISDWCDSRAWISSGVLRVRLQPNALSAASGLISNIRIADGTAYELDYDIRFHSLFEWSRGGKLGFGFLVGDGNTGGNPAWDGNGGSMRLIWYQNTNGRVVFEPYLYYKDQPSTTGDNFATTYPAVGSIQRGKWYHVHLYIRSNTADNVDGRARMEINGTVILDRAIRWTTIDSKRFIRNVCFHTFRGGDTQEYMASTLSYIYYDNLVIRRVGN
ncbi:MAG: hypothetical protein JST39_04425 [Bacteroidetes bacterium]|nr:hypothetical protein [Bacteroidota bacterium]